MQEALLQTDLPYPKRQGKVRDVYDLGDRLLIVSTDRISAFDWVMPNGIPDKGRILNQLSLFWFRTLGVEHHVIDDKLPAEIAQLDPQGHLQGRSIVTRKAQVVPFECVIRGYIEGSGWRDAESTCQPGSTNAMHSDPRCLPRQPKPNRATMKTSPSNK